MKRGQVAIWVILAIVLVGTILLFLFFRNGSETVGVIDRATPTEATEFIRDCAGDNVIETVDLMLPRGGFVQPKNFVRFDGTDIEYLCQTTQYYEPCVQQHPVLLKEMEKEIGERVYNKIDECFDEMQREFSKRHAKISYLSPLEVGVRIVPGKIVLDLDRDAVIENENGKQTVKNFEVSFSNAAFELANIGLEIAAQQAKYCYFETAGYSLTYPRYRVTLYNGMPDSSKIYTINDSRTNQFMRIAVKSCVIPEGV